MSYVIMSKGYYWVMRDLMCNKWPEISYSCTTSLSQWQYQIKIKRALLGQSNWTSHSIAVRLSSLNVLRESRRRNPPSSS